MTTQHTQNEVWQGMLNAARLSRYYNSMADRYQRRYQIVQAVLFIAATGGFVAVLAAFPSAVGLVANLLVAVVAAVSFTTDYGKTSYGLRSISRECLSLELDWNTLWQEQSGMADAEVIQRNRELNDRLDTITDQSGLLGVTDDDKLNERCQTDAYEVMEQHYAATYPTE